MTLIEIYQTWNCTSGNLASMPSFSPNGKTSCVLQLSGGAHGRSGKIAPPPAGFSGKNLPKADNFAVVPLFLHEACRPQIALRLCAYGATISQASGVPARISPVDSALRLRLVSGGSGPPT